VISLIVHGGAWAIPDHALVAHREGVLKAVKAGWSVLLDGGASADAVERAVMMMEDDKTFNAGRGSVLNAAGEVEMDASMMEGKTYRTGAVAALQRIAHPVSVARLVMEKSAHVLLVGLGAARFAREHGVRVGGKDDLITSEQLTLWRKAQGAPKKERKKGHDTVGAIALDKKGNIVAAASTGGTPNKYPCRVGDSPIVGSGIYADNKIGAAVSTGEGEEILRVVLAKIVIDVLERNGGDPDAAARDGIELLRRKVHGHGGVIVMNSTGKVGIAWNTPRMARAFMATGMKSPVAFV
jgi:beta-aspartyl-peptidase (threonine type)